jgi:hypothetical protein
MPYVVCDLPFATLGIDPIVASIKYSTRYLHYTSPSDPEPITAGETDDSSYCCSKLNAGKARPTLTSISAGCSLQRTKRAISSDISFKALEQNFFYYSTTRDRDY